MSSFVKRSERPGCASIIVIYDDKRRYRVRYRITAKRIWIDIRMPTSEIAQKHYKDPGVFQTRAEIVEGRGSILRLPEFIQIKANCFANIGGDDRGTVSYLS